MPIAPRLATAPRRIPAVRHLGLALLTTAVFCLVGAGLLLWWRQGDAVFGQYLLGALAWCF